MVEEEGEEKSSSREWIALLVAGVFFALGIILSFWEFPLGETFRYTSLSIAYLIVGAPIFIATVKNLAKGRVFDENFLMTIASIGAVLLGAIQGGDGTIEGVAVLYLYSLGEYLQGVAVGSSRKSVKELLLLKSERAYKKLGEEWVEIPPEQLLVGDIVLVRTGEKIPVDGKLLKGVATIDTKPLTGEAEWKNYEEGAEILSGNINVGKEILLQVVRTYEESAVKKILDMVEGAVAKRSKPEKFIGKFARYYTPIVCLLAVCIAIVPPLFFSIGKGGFNDYLPRFILTALEFLVISCPCALVISVPLSYFCGIGALAKRGILAKGSVYLDVMAKTKVVAFDKTGTLTEGNFTILAVRTKKAGDEEELLALSSALEIHSTHPLASAFKKGKYDGENVEEFAGKGLVGEVGNRKVVFGSGALLEEFNIPYEKNPSSNTTLYMAVDGEYFGYIEIGDEMRKDAVEVVKALQKTGKDVVVLTGDKKEKGEELAKKLGIARVEGELLPIDKLKKAEELKKEGVLTYVGDGINDAPVMATADCSVSMGKLGSAVAVETSDLVLISDRLLDFLEGFRIAKKTRKIVFQNIVFSLIMKGAFMVASLWGALPLWVAVFGDVGVMMLAVLNALRVQGK